MIIREYLTTRNDGVGLYKTYSADGYKIRKVGTDEVYDEAIDIETAPYEYEETDIKVEPHEESETEAEVEETETEAVEEICDFSV